MKPLLTKDSLLSQMCKLTLTCYSVTDMNFLNPCFGKECILLYVRSCLFVHVYAYVGILCGSAFVGALMCSRLCAHALTFVCSSVSVSFFSSVICFFFAVGHLECFSLK